MARSAQTRRACVARARHVFRPRLDALEERRLLSTFQVTNTGDSGPGSLRQAILDNNADTVNSDANTIEFAIPGTGVHTIQPLTELPTVTHPVFMDGYSQPGSSKNTLAVGNDAVLTIELNGTGTYPADFPFAGYAHGLRIAADNSTVQGLVVNRFDFAGISLTGANDAIQGCFIGTDPSGTLAQPNAYNGVELAGAGTRLGTNGDGIDDYAERNLVSGNITRGVQAGPGTVVAGNYIGTDRTGTIALPNGLLDPGRGLGVEAAPGSRVGVDGHHDNPEAERNVISGNLNTGVHAYAGSVVAGNYIGIDATGTQPLGNTNIGVTAEGGVRIGTDGDGHADVAERNVISNNSQQGLYVSGQANHIAGNYIGTDASGSYGMGGQPTGILVYGYGTHNHIGLDPADSSPNRAAKGNLISGNTYVGVQLNGHENTVAGNWLGPDATGTRGIAGSNGAMQIGGQGNLIGTDADGANDALERNVISGNLSGIEINGGNDNVVAGNYIGTDPTGTTIANLGNGQFSSGSGIIINYAGSGNTIGGSSTAARNIIAGSAFGIRFYAHGDPGNVASGNVVEGNYIGTDVTGRVALGNLLGVNLLSGTSNRIGGSAPGEGNVISGNSQVGVYIHWASSGNQVLGNWIGTDPTGLLRPGLGNSNGVGIDDSASLNQIGGTSPGQGNTIAYNGVGVVLPQRNLAPAVTGNSIRGNSIHGNDGQGIDLGADGVTHNGSHDPDEPGPNHWQTFPVLSAAYAGPSSYVVGTLTSTPNTTFAVNFYSNPDPNPGYGEGQSFLGSTTVTTDGSGAASFVVAGLAASVTGEWISATATGTDGTSEFAQNAQAVPLPPSSLSGIVFSDFNNDSEVDFGEQGIAGVTIDLNGTDFFGNAVHLCQLTDADGAYVFLNLLPGTYRLAETQPAEYTQGINHVGTAGGSVTLDQFDLYLGLGLDGLNYNYGERPAATGTVGQGQTAGIGFWNNKNGQALIKALNGSSTSTQLGDWLAATFPHMFGASSASNNLAGKTNAYVASFFQSRFVVKDQKLDAQVMATALAVYVTDATLDSTGVGTQYGFVVGGNGVATATFNVGANGEAFGVANNTTLTVMDILLAADAQAVNGVLYNGNTAKRSKANTVFSTINQAGGI